MPDILMQCGDRAHASCGTAHFGLEPGHPSCMIHAISQQACTVATELPNLEGRQARCSVQCELRPSSLSLAFFEYRGEGSRAAKENCAKCGYYETAHKPEGDKPRNRSVCLSFVPHGPYEFDNYYCGCCGWD